MKETVPLSALENHIAFLAKTGAGKSNAAKTIVEGLLDRGERVCVVDPTGTWWGLRLMPNDKPSKYKILIFGGQHADIQITGRDGAAIAQVVGTSATSCIIDTRLMKVSERTQFFTDFAEALLRTNKGVLNLVIDEAHVFAPKGKVADPRSGMMLGAATNLVSLGRGIGLRIMLLTQRPAKLHNDALGQVETLVAMRMMLPHDRAAVMDWVKEQADVKKGQEITASLPGLPTGDAWIWAPQLELLERRRFPLVKTKDTGKPLSAEESGVELAPLEIKKITALMTKVAADVVANDPKALKAEVERLKRELAAKPAPAVVDPAIAEAEKKKLYADGLAAGIKHGVQMAAMAIDKIVAEMPVGAEPKVEPRAAAAPPPKPAPPPVERPPAAPPSGNGEVTGPQSHLLGALSWWEMMGHMMPSRPQIAAIAGWKVTSGHLKNILGQLRTRGLVDFPASGLVMMTAEGKALAPEPDTSLSFVDRLRGTLSGPQRTLYDALRSHGGPMARPALAEAVGWEPTSGHLKNIVGQLNTLDVVNYPAQGMVELQPWAAA